MDDPVGGEPGEQILAVRESTWRAAEAERECLRAELETIRETRNRYYTDLVRVEEEANRLRTERGLLRAVVDAMSVVAEHAGAGALEDHPDAVRQLEVALVALREAETSDGGSEVVSVERALLRSVASAAADLVDAHIEGETQREAAAWVNLGTALGRLPGEETDG